MLKRLGADPKAARGLPDASCGVEISLAAYRPIARREQSASLVPIISFLLIENAGRSIADVNIAVQAGCPGRFACWALMPA